MLFRAQAARMLRSITRYGGLRTDITRHAAITLCSHAAARTPAHHHSIIDARAHKQSSSIWSSMVAWHHRPMSTCVNMYATHQQSLSSLPQHRSLSSTSSLPVSIDGMPLTKLHLP